MYSYKIQISYSTNFLDYPYVILIKMNKQTSAMSVCPGFGGQVHSKKFWTANGRPMFGQQTDINLPT